MYDADVFHRLVSKVTDAVIDQVHAWNNRPLDYILIIYLDCIIVKICPTRLSINLYLALGINSEGYAETEGAKFWLSILTELHRI